MDSKICTKCKRDRQLADFNKCSREADGLQDWCKQCFKEASARYRKANAEKDRARHAKYHQANKAMCNKRTGDWQKNNPEKVRAKSRKYYHSHKESEAARMKAWEAKNPDWKKHYTKKWREENLGRRKAYEARYAEENRHLINAKTARRRAALLRATPAWADHAKIEAVYAACVEITEITGVEHHVDHIVPLRSKIVCGLHWSGNLQIITGSENSRKHNSYWPNTP